jgi:hypothetical protein
MNSHQLIPRIVENKDWVTFLFMGALFLVVVTKSVFENRFIDFSNLIFSNKYLKVYKDSSNLMTWFTVALFFVQVISLSFFIQILLSHLGYTTKTNVFTFIRIFTFLLYFILAKYLIEKIIATSFNIESHIEQFNLLKVGYRNYAGLLLLPVNIVLFYTNTLNNYLIISITVILLLVNVVTYSISLKIYQNLIFSKLFYFILYICTLEIAPYYFVYYLVKRS